MDRVSLLEQLVVAMRHVAEGHNRIVRQKYVIGRLQEGGQTTGEAVALLKRFETAQMLQVRDRDRLVHQLTEDPVRY